MVSLYVQTLRKELEATKLKFFNGDIEKWNADLSIEEQTDLLPYDKQWEFPKNKLKLSNIINTNITFQDKQKATLKIFLKFGFVILHR